MIHGFSLNVWLEYSKYYLK